MFVQNRNNVNAIIDAGVLASATSIVVRPQDADQFPDMTLPGANPFYVTMEKVSVISTVSVVTKREIALCTNRAGNILTVTRGADFCVQDDSAATKTYTDNPLDFDVGDIISMRLVAKELQDNSDAIENIDNEIQNIQTNGFVDLTNDQTVGGVKTTVDYLRKQDPYVAPTLDNQYITKKYADDKVDEIISQGIPGSNNLGYVAGENINTNEVVFFEKDPESADATVGINIGENNNNLRYTFPIIGNGDPMAGTDFVLSKTGSLLFNVYFRVETDDNGQPSGTLFDPVNSLATVNEALITTDPTTSVVSVSRTGAFTIPEGQICHIVLGVGTYGSEIPNSSAFLKIFRQDRNTTTRTEGLFSPTENIYYPNIYDTASPGLTLQSFPSSDIKFFNSYSIDEENNLGYFSVYDELGSIVAERNKIYVLNMDDLSTVQIITIPLLFLGVSSGPGTAPYSSSASSLLYKAGDNLHIFLASNTGPRLQYSRYNLLSNSFESSIGLSSAGGSLYRLPNIKILGVGIHTSIPLINTTTDTIERFDFATETLTPTSVSTTAFSLKLDSKENLYYIVGEAGIYSNIDDTLISTLSSGIHTNFSLTIDGITYTNTVDSISRYNTSNGALISTLSLGGTSTRGMYYYPIYDIIVMERRVGGSSSVDDIQTINLSTFTIGSTLLDSFPTARGNGFYIGNNKGLVFDSVRRAHTYNIFGENLTDSRPLFPYIGGEGFSKIVGSKADARYSYKITDLGIALANALKGETKNASVAGPIALPNLTPKIDYFVSDTPGDLSTTAGTNSKVVGRTITDKHLYIKANN